VHASAAIGLAALALTVGAPAASTPTSGVAGRVLAGPTCPIERPGDPACAPRPVVAIVDVTTTLGRRLRRVPTDRSGRFRIGLAPGVYVLTPSTGTRPFPIGKPSRVRVVAHRVTQVVLHMDTGIR
jgi:hypothetical protein